MDFLVDTNVVLLVADRDHAAWLEARNMMRSIFRQGGRLCLAKQSLIEAWGVAPRPPGLNGFGLSPIAFKEQFLESLVFGQHCVTVMSRSS